MFPISKYDFYTTKANETIAVSTYAGRTVRGKAKVDPPRQDVMPKLLISGSREHVTK